MVTADVVVSIFKLRSPFKWGTARVQNGLFKLPSFMIDAVPIVQEVRLFRKIINRVLIVHGVNGCSHGMNAGSFSGLKSRMGCGRLTSRVRFGCRARSTGFWCVSTIIAAFPADL